MKKYLIFLLIFIITVLSGCAQEKIPEVPEIPEDAVWDRNQTEHWINGENGEKLHIGEHELNEEGFCTVCESFVEYWTDGGADVCNYDEKYNLTRSTSYDSEGNILFDYVMEYEYNEKGALSYSATYQNGRLYEETEYLEEEIIISYYEEDGSYSIEIGRKGPEETDEIRYYDSEGSIVRESYKKMFLNEEGAVYLTELTEIYHSSEIKQISEFNANGDILSVKSYNLSDKLLSAYDYVYEYSEENCVSYQKILLNGELYEEVFYTIVTEGDPCYSRKNKAIIYYENGSKLVLEYDETGNEKSATNYDADGNVIE